MQKDNRTTPERQSHTQERQSHTTERQSHTTERQSHTPERQSHTTERQSYNTRKAIAYTTIVQHQKDNRTTPERQSYNTRTTIVQHQKDNRIHHNRTTPERQPYYCTTSTPKLNNLHHQIKASVLLRSSLLYLCIVFNDPTWKLITCHQSWFATCLFLLSTMD